MVRTGLDVLVAENFARLRGLKVGLLTHQPAVDAHLRPILPLMHAAGVRIEALFGPEHGFGGAAQDMEVVPEIETRDPLTGARIYSLYGAEESSLYPTDAMFSGVDVLVVDLQDVGARYYTYAATMGYALRTAAQTNTRVLVLDRPNPLGGRDEDIEGPALRYEFRSFVGAFDMSIRHGLTLAEYAAWVRNQEHLDVELEWIEMEGWRRDMAFDQTGLPWVMPSPNMPTLDTAWIYPGQCLLEGTNLSEGRGTTRPFELCGAPWLDGQRWAELAQPHVGPGIVLRPTVIKPMFQKHSGRSCGALQIHVTDRWRVRSLQLTTALMVAARKLAPQFAWRTERYEYITDRLAIDLLYGSSSPRQQIEAGEPAEAIVATFAADEAQFREARRSVLLY